MVTFSFRTLLPCSDFGSSFKWKNLLLEGFTLISTNHSLCSILFPWAAGVSTSQQLPQCGRNCPNSTTISCYHSRRKCSTWALEGRKRRGGIAFTTYQICQPADSYNVPAAAWGFSTCHLQDYTTVRGKGSQTAATPTELWPQNVGERAGKVHWQNLNLVQWLKSIQAEIRHRCVIWITLTCFKTNSPLLFLTLSITFISKMYIIQNHQSWKSAL